MEQAKIKPRQVFHQAVVEDLQQPVDDIKPLLEQVVFGEDVTLNYQIESTQQEQMEALLPLDKILVAPAKKWSIGGKLLVGFATVIVGIETADFFTNLWLNEPFSAIIYTGAASLALGLAFKAGINEYRYLKRLKQLNRWQQAADRMKQGEQIGEALVMCNRISKTLPADPQITTALSQWRSSLQDNFTDKEVLLLYSETVLNQIDAQAMKVVSRYATETALMIAISPIAVLDMALVLWRSLKMVDEICGLYGVKLGYWSRIRLIKVVIKNVIFAGVSELITDVGAAALSLELAGKLSACAAQGLGAGLLTGRLGFKVIQVCRPLPALPNKQKGLGDLSKQLFGNIRRALVGGKA